jgi:anthranilate phosphoribosyltransferase
MLGVDRALVVASADGLDEISICAPTKVGEVNGEEIRRYTLRPGDVGLEQASVEAAESDCGGGTPEQNAALTRALFGGEPAGAASADLAAINAGAAIYAAGRAESIAAGVDAARTALAEGGAGEALERFVQASRRYAPAEAPT